jgi:hypothetical protein
MNLLLGIAMIALCVWHIFGALKTGAISGRGDVVLKRYERPLEFWANIGAFMILGAVGVAMIVMGIFQAPSN